MASSFVIILAGQVNIYIGMEPVKILVFSHWILELKELLQEISVIILVSRLNIFCGTALVSVLVIFL